MKSLAKPNNTQSHFDFGQAAGPTKTYGKRTKKNQKRSEKERRKKKHRKGHSLGHILRRFICILFLLTNSLQIYRFSCPAPATDLFAIVCIIYGQLKAFTCEQF